MGDADRRIRFQYLTASAEIREILHTFGIHSTTIQVSIFVHLEHHHFLV